MRLSVILVLFSLLGVTTSQDLDSIVVPRKTDIFVKLGRTINTKTAQIGDRFFGNVSVPVTVDDQIIIPVGSYLIGQVAEVDRAGRVKGKSQIRLTWDTLILPSGVTRKIRTVLDSAENQSTRNTDEDGRIEGEGTQGKDIAKGAAKVGVIGVLTGAAAGGSWAGAGVGAAVGAGAGALLGLFKRGEDIVLEKGSGIIIQTETDISFEKPAPSKPTQTLNQ